MKQYSARNGVLGRLVRLSRQAQAGFTLIEIMVVITILAILSVLVVPKLVGRTDEARRVAAKVQIKSIEEGLQMYKLDNGDYPSTEQGLDALVNKPSVGEIPKNWREGGYLPKIPADPWGNQYVYVSPGTHGDFDLLSYGADGEGGGEGKSADIESWNME
ncbi:type II secretion system major pseudopilin GspG [Candidatus Manganitrophus noduliformans]|uniref:Type II secretion system core protein G n=1 Tax=Candidatus Manganitrophus noduliformans TaxID=2606439 RepID=A0A7X6DQ86_9BACT|nr:type II secretion system major pseudopilin GspG [Candidatus Manganitrophus noduliformans]NKE71398.1 type II secretion system protein GspG [Candidatus Manganitrophus noduliformans]